MDGNIGIDLEAESYLHVLNVEHRDFKHALEAVGPSDDNRFLVFPRQDQHGRTSVFMSDRPVHSRSKRPQGLSMRIDCPRQGKQKKADVAEYLRDSATSAYSSTSLPA